MEERVLRAILFAKDTREVYLQFRELEQLCEVSDELYQYIDVYIEAIHDPISCARGRGFKLIAANARWDKDNRINSVFDEILTVLDDDKAPVVRQCIPWLSQLIIYKKELIPLIEDKLNSLNYMKYKESMQSLIKRDIENLRHQYII